MRDGCRNKERAGSIQGNMVSMLHDLYVTDTRNLPMRAMIEVEASVVSSLMLSSDWRNDRLRFSPSGSLLGD